MPTNASESAMLHRFRQKGLMSDEMLKGSKSQPAGFNQEPLSLAPLRPGLKPLLKPRHKAVGDSAVNNAMIEG